MNGTTSNGSDVARLLAYPCKRALSVLVLFAASAPDETTRRYWRA